MTENRGMPGASRQPATERTASPMPLSPIPDRTPQHERDVRYRSYARADGLWDIEGELRDRDRKSTRLNSSHLVISYAVFCLKKKKKHMKIPNKVRLSTLCSIVAYATHY